MRGSDNEVDPGRDRRRRAESYEGRHRPAEAIRARRKMPWQAPAGTASMRRPAAAALLVSIGIGSLCLVVGGADPGRQPTAAVDLELRARVPIDRRGEAVSRSTQRAVPGLASPTPAVSASAAAAASPSVRASPSPSVKPRPTRPAPVGGLSQVQMDYAATIVSAGKQLNLPKQAYVIAVATALQESRLLELANWAVPESLGLRNDGVGGDHDSVGLFQQRPSSGWGTVKELMDPATSARRFYQALAAIPGWQGMSVAGAAQAVQVSAFPDAYAQQQSLATLIVNALT